jgi:transposase
VAWQIVTKTVNGNKYQYGKQTHKSSSEPNSEVYLGTADDIVAIVQAFHHPPAPEVTDREFGAVAALWSVAEQLGVIEKIDTIFPKRSGSPSIGTYLMVGAISRCLEPVSKRATPDWFDKTILPRLVGYEGKCFSSQRFWDNCHELHVEGLEQAQQVIAHAAVDEFDLNAGHLIYDATNYDTYLDTNNPNPLASRGHAKSKRNDLKVVGLAAMVTADGHVPLLHEAFPGSDHDSKEFAHILPKLSEAAKAICHHEPDITLVFDKGNNAKDTWELWNDTPFSFIGSLAPSDYPDLLEIPLSQYEALGTESPELTGCLAYRQTKHVLGGEYEVVVTYNPELYEGQMQGIEHNIAKCQKDFNEHTARLERWHRGEVKKGRKPTVATVTTKAHEIAGRQHMKRLWQITVAEENGLPRLNVSFDHDALHALQTTLLGKSIIFTDRHAWATAEIVSGYRSQWRIEEMFRWSKDRRRNSWEPTFHWTEPMVRVHTFCCMLGITLTSLLLRELNQHDFQLSQRSMLDHLEGIRETQITYPAVGRFPAASQTILHQMTGIQQGLFHQLKLTRFCQPTISSSRRPPSRPNGK